MASVDSPAARDAAAEALFAGPGEMRARCRAFDWTATPLGPVANWSPSLRIVVGTVMASPQAMWIGWGSSLTQIYNDAYTRLNDRTPGSLGRPTAETWEDVWHLIGPEMESVRDGGPAVVQEDRLIPFRVGDAVEAMYWTYSYSPIPDAAAPHGVGGVLCFAWETTARVRSELASRETQERQEFLLQLSDALRAISDPIAVQATATRLLGEYLRANRVCYVEMSETESVVHQDYVSGVRSIAGRWRNADFGQAMEQALRTGRTNVVSDMRALPGLSDTERANYAAIDVGAQIVVTLFKEGRWIANFGVHSASPREWTSLEVQLTEETAERTWAAVERARAETTVRQSETKYRSLFENMNDGLAVCAVVRDDSGRAVDMTYLEMNQAVERQTRLGREAFIGRRLSDTSTKAEFEQWMPLHSRVADTGEPVTGETYSEPTGRWFDFTIYRSGEDEHSIVVRDTSERKRAEEALRESEAHLAKELEDARVLQTISNQLVSEGGPNGHFNHIIEVARTLMRSDAASIQELDAVDSRLKLLAHTGFHAESAAFWAYVDADVGSSCGRALTAHKRVVVPDMDEFEADPHDVAAYRKSGIMSVQSTPLVASSGRIVGMMSTHWYHPHTPSADSYRFFDILARLAADFMERARTEAALRESEGRYRNLFETMRQGYIENELIRDVDGRAVDFRTKVVNPQFERLTGISAGEAVGRTARELVGELDPAWIETYDRVVRTGEPEQFEREEPAFGRWFEVQAYPLTGDRFAILYDDITERRRTDAALRESEERQAFLLKLSDDYRANPGEDAVGRTCVQALAAHMGVDRCYITELSSELNRGLVGAEYYEPGLVPIAGEHRYSNYPNAIRDLQNGEPFVTSDVDNDARLSDTDKASIGSGLGLQAMISAALHEGQGNSIWALTVGSAKPRAWTSEDLRLVQDVTERTWAPIERARTQRLALEEAERVIAARTSERDALRRQLSQAEEAERQRLSRELHDQLGQQLTAFRLGLEDAGRLAAEHRDGRQSADASLSARIRELQTLADAMMRGARYIALELRPPELDDVGFAGALETYVREWADRYRISAEVTVMPSLAGEGTFEDGVPQAVGSALYRIAQEGLTNIAKHAQATQVSIVIDVRDSEVRLIMEDDGRGFDLEEARTRARHERQLGLGGMEERAALMGGKLIIESTPESGTTLYARVPLHS